MAFTVRNYAWTPVSSGIRTRIAQGPLVHGAPVQWLEFGHRGIGANPTVTFFVTVYSAAPPWYLTASGTAPESNLLDDGRGGLYLGMAPWSVGFPLWLLASPWIEVFVTTNRNCLARLDVF